MTMMIVVRIELEVFGQSRAGFIFIGRGVALAQRDGVSLSMCVACHNLWHGLDQNRAPQLVHPPTSVTNPLAAQSYNAGGAAVSLWLGPRNGSTLRSSW